MFNVAVLLVSALFVEVVTAGGRFHGNMLKPPGIPSLRWKDHKHQLSAEMELSSLL